MAIKQTACFAIRANDQETVQYIDSDTASIMAALKAEALDVHDEYEPTGAMPSGISKLGTVYMSIEGLIDVETELKKIQGELELIEGHLKGVQAKLANSNFVDRAPKEVVAVQEAKEIELKEKREKLEQNIALFKKV